MKLSKRTIYHCFIPFLCVLPMLGIMSCSADEAVDTTANTVDFVGERITSFPENMRTAAPFLQEDLEQIWYNIAGTLEVYAEDMGYSEPSHPLAEARQVRQKLIAGATFDEVVDNAMHELTEEDLENMPSEDLSALNGILPFEVNLESCGDNLAEVLNTLDIGQVSAILQSEAGYHLIQLLERNGGSVRIGHVVFEIGPALDSTDDNDPELTADAPSPTQDAIAKLAQVLGSN